MAGSIAAFLKAHPSWALIQRWLMGTLPVSLSGWRWKADDNLRGHRGRLVRAQGPAVLLLGATKRLRVGM
jgi:hypothetical protein